MECRRRRPALRRRAGARAGSAWRGGRASFGLNGVEGLGFLGFLEGLDGLDERLRGEVRVRGARHQLLEDGGDQDQRVGLEACDLGPERLEEWEQGLCRFEESVCESASCDEHFAVSLVDDGFLELVPVERVERSCHRRGGARGKLHPAYLAGRVALGVYLRGSTKKTHGVL